jgi:hypothetical protein
MFERNIMDLEFSILEQCLNKAFELKLIAPDCTASEFIGKQKALKEIIEFAMQQQTISNRHY